MEFKNFDKTKSYEALLSLKKRNLNLRDLLKKDDRVEKYIAESENLSYSYACKEVDEEILEILEELSLEQELLKKYEALLEGETMNTGENRKVLHHLLRGELAGRVEFNGINLGEFYREQRNKVYQIAEDINSGKIESSSGKKFKNVVQIGIGGSDLGPRAMYIALASCKKPSLNADFISNVDPVDANLVLSKIDLKETLFILVSKSGNTQETLANEVLVTSILEHNGIKNPKKNFLCVTAKGSPLSNSKEYLDSIFIDDFIGGRYSSTSPVGILLLAICFGKKVVEEFLQGASEQDKLSLEKQVRKNLSMLDALIGVYDRNFLNYECTAVLPYSQALLRFTAHLQQLDMESNGKSVNRNWEEVSYKTGPIIFGEPGTNGQHSFYQLLHQGKTIVPMQFIGFIENLSEEDVEVQGSSSFQKLNANLVAQICAFALGKNDDNLSKKFEGSRPSSLIFAQKLTPKTLGALLSHYENKVMFQGFIWNLNSFDQEGVQLGKVLANKVLKEKDNITGILKSFSRIMKI